MSASVRLRLYKLLGTFDVLTQRTGFAGGGAEVM